MAKLEGERDTAKAALAAAEQRASDEAAKAAAYCSKEAASSAKLPRNASCAQPGAAELQALLKTAEARIAREAQRNRRPYEEVQTELAAARRDFLRQQRLLEHSLKPARRMHELYKVRHALLKATAKKIHKTVSHNFNIHLQQRGHSGGVKINYSAATLELSVQLADVTGGAGGDGRKKGGAGRH
jgi:hypothetical protein